MKSHHFAIVAGLAAATSIALVPFNAVAAGLLFTATGVIVMLSADYGRSPQPLRPRAQVIAFPASRSNPAELRAA